MIYDHPLITIDTSLIQAAEAWLPTRDPETKEKILGYMRDISASGLDPIAALQHGLTVWFGSSAAEKLLMHRQSQKPQMPGEISLEMLAQIRRPTMWPQRPKRIPGELFSSWLWRTAVAAGVGSRNFVKELKLDGDEIDREITAPILMYLGQRSGQSFSHLAAGTLVPWFQEFDTSPTGSSEAGLLKDGRFLLMRNGRHRLERQRAILQYCPRCLQTDQRPFFRRAWRFGHNVVCVEHGCRLYDGCWHCGELVSPLRFRAMQAQPHCTKCDVPLSKGPLIDARRIRPRQRALMGLLCYLTDQVKAEERMVHLDALSREFHEIQFGTVVNRERGLANLRPIKIDVWFGAPLRQEHAMPLRILARGVHYENLAKSLRLRERRVRLYSKFGDLLIEPDRCAFN